VESIAVGRLSLFVLLSVTTPGLPSVAADGVDERPGDDGDDGGDGELEGEVDPLGGGEFEPF